MVINRIHNILDDFEKMRDRRASRTQKLEDLSDIDLLVSGKDVLEVQRTNYPDCAPEFLLYIIKGKKNLILWGADCGGRGDRYGRVIKLPLKEISINGSLLKIPNYTFNLFFNLKERSYIKLQEAGLLP